MDSRTNAINTTLTTVGALILLAVLAWVVYTISQPRVPNTGADVPQNNIEIEQTAASATGGTPTSTDRMLESVDDAGGTGGGSNDPTGNSHSE